MSPADAGEVFPQQVTRYLPSHLAAQLPDPTVHQAIAEHLGALLRTVSTYLPRRLVRALLARRIPGQVWGERVQGTLLFADLSGFTALSAALSRQGLAGAEQMVSIVNAIFTTMLEIIEKEDGDLLVFGGDALSVLFAEEGHALAALRAARSMQQAMGLFAQIETEAGPFPLTLHIGVNSGEFLAASLGLPHAMQYVLLGQAVEETARAEDLAGPGETVVGAAAAGAVPSPHIWQPLEWPWLRLDPAPPLPPSGRKRQPLLIPENIAAVSSLDALAPYLPAGLLERLIPYPAEPTVEADLKPVAVLFANLLGTAALLDQLGPDRWEEAVALLQGHIASLQEAAERYGGTLNKIDLSPEGVKLMVLFGAPSKHEDDPERAVHAALDMRAAVEKARLEAGNRDLGRLPTPSFQLRIGLHTGDVFAGNVGSSWRKEYTVMGTPVNLAARLMAAAEPGQAWASTALYDRAGPGCQVAGRRDIQFKGVEEPVTVFQVRGLQSVARAIPSCPLVGRKQEMATMLAALDEAAAGHGRLLSLIGEAGVGKSRLVEETIAAAREQGFRVRAGHTPSYGERIPYAPWTDVLRAGLGWTSAMSAEEQGLRLKQHLASLSPDLEPWAPVLAEVLGLAMPETPLTAGLAPRLRRQRFFDLSLQLLQADAAGQPLLVILEDLHWAGALTGELLTYLGRNVAHDGVLLLGTRRPATAPSPWQGLPHHRVIELAPLRIAACQEMVAHLTGCSSLDPALADLIWERALGNPLFIEEIVQVLEGHGVLEQVDGLLRLRDDPERARQEIPPTIQEVILSRIDHLPEGLRSTLRVAAVIDAEFLFPVLVAIFPHRDPEAVLRERVEQLCQTGMLSSTGPQTYAFHHTLTREVAYQSMPHARRRSLHERVAHYYEEHFADHLEQYYAFLAHHYRHSADQPKAVEYALKSGRQAAHSYDNEAAATYFQQALELEERYPGLLTIPRKVQVHRERGDVLLEASRFADALAAYQRALHDGEDFLPDSATAELYRLTSYVYERSGRYDESLDALQQAHRVLLRGPGGPGSLEMARVLAAMGTVYWRNGAYDEASRCGEEALAIAQAAPPDQERPGLLGQIYVRQGNVALTTGQLQDAQRYFEQGLHFYEQAGQLPDIAIAQNNLGYLWHKQDEYPRAIEHYRRCLEAARQIGSPYITAYAANNLGSSWYELGDCDLAMEYCRESLAVRERIGDRAGQASCWDTMGLIHIVRGEYAQALELHQRSLALKQELGDTFAEANSLINLARTHYAQGGFQECVALSEKALQILQGLDTQASLAEAHGVAAEALLALGQWPEAGRHAEAAMRSATATGGRKDGAIAARALAEARAADPAADPEETVRLFQESIATLGTLGCRLEQALSSRAYGEFLNGRGENGQQYLEQAGCLLQEIGAGRPGTS
jgi:adenylate cyclase